MNVAYWNVNMGEGSPGTKLDAYAAWVKTISPDVLFLEEVSFKLLEGKSPEICEKSVDALGKSYRLIDYVNTLDVNGDPTTKCIAALCTEAISVDANPAATVLKVSGDMQIRAMLKVTSLKWGGVGLYGLHANASVKGGTDAVSQVASYIPWGGGAYFGGDFNCEILSAEKIADPKNAFPLMPVGYGGGNLPFTQWTNLGSGTTPKGLYGNNRLLNIAIKPNGIIDYVVCGNPDAGNIAALPNANADLWTLILTQFDHCPVVYAIVV